MKLTIKTLQQSTFKIDIEPDKTVKQLKEKIENDRGKDYPLGSQKLIYNGKILADESKLDEYMIDEKKFIVLMITRPPPAAKLTSTTTTKETPSVVKKEEASSAPSIAASKSKDDKNKPSATGSASGTSRASTCPSSTTATPNPANTATPSANVSAPTAQTRNTPARNPPAGARDASLTSEPQVASRLASLMTDPLFRQMQDVIQHTPHALLSLRFEELASTNPEMYRFISENPDAFVNMLNHPPSVGSGNLSLSRNHSSDDVQSSLLQGSGREQVPAADQTFLADVSQHDREAIERLKELGFSEYQAIQAYMACDKDEQLAANLLFQMEQ